MANEVSIVGLGASGVAAARLALRKGEKVYVSDTRSDAQARAAQDQLRTLGADVELGGHDQARIAASSVVVVSPGVPPDAQVLRALAERGVGWISEPEFAFRFFHGPLIAVTGTNGKTTTATLTAHLLGSAGYKVALGGNIGAALGPAASELALREPAPDWYVLEMSSFQLADIETFRADVGVLTNLAPDHLDRYASVESYYADKSRLFENADSRSRWVLNADDPRALELAGEAPGTRRYFSLEREVEGAFLEGDRLVLATDEGAEILLDRRELPLLGRHNVANALAAAVAATLAGAPTEALQKGLGSARSLPHRLDPVLEESGVLWVNDSKATNVAAARSAVESLSRPLILLLGGKDKGEDFRGLRSPIQKKKVRHVVAYGAARERIERELSGAAPLTRVDGSFKDAVTAARWLARQGDVLLLSPACSSFDMFENYERRGEAFAALARTFA